MKYVVIGFLAIGLFFSCTKKDTSSGEISANLSKLQGQWTFLNKINNQHYSDMDHMDTVAGAAGDYMNFSSGGNLYVRLLSFQDTSKYAVIINNRVVFDAVDTFDLKTLSDAILILDRKTIYSGGAFYEETYNLRR